MICRAKPCELARQVLVRETAQANTLAIESLALSPSRFASASSRSIPDPEVVGPAAVSPDHHPLRGSPRSLPRPPAPDMNGTGLRRLVEEFLSIR